MSSIQGVSVLVVDDSEDTRELFQIVLESEGARVTVASSAAEALDALRASMPDVLVTDLTLPDEDGVALLRRAHADPNLTNVPAIAVTGHSDSATRARVFDAGFRKILTKPVETFTLVAAIASAAGTGNRAANQAQSLASLIGQRDMKALLTAINAATRYRFTSILRFDRERLESVWTYDRERAAADEFPSDTRVEASYCAFVRRDEAPFRVVDASTDPRTADHPKRSALRAYCGVPIFRADRTLFGSLCHYDERPREYDEGTIESLQRVAALLSPILQTPSER